MDWLTKAIEKTISYGRSFNVEYGAEQIKQRLISNKIFDERLIDKRLNELMIGSKRLQKNYKEELAIELANKLKKTFDDILLICVTGSVAAGFPDKEDDIDLMIITKKDRLWLTRLLLRLYIKFNNIPHRRYGKKEVGDSFCFNLWLEEDVLRLPKNKRNLRNAMDAILMVPILNKKRTYEKFMSENRWIKKYLANPYVKNH